VQIVASTGALQSSKWHFEFFQMTLDKMSNVSWRGGGAKKWAKKFCGMLLCQLPPCSMLTLAALPVWTETAEQWTGTGQCTTEKGKTTWMLMRGSFPFGRARMSPGMSLGTARAAVSSVEGQVASQSSKHVGVLGADV
jgi:hypothetical protein